MRLTSESRRPRSALERPWPVALFPLLLNYLTSPICTCTLERIVPKRAYPRSDASRLRSRPSTRGRDTRPEAGPLDPRRAHPSRGGSISPEAGPSVPRRAHQALSARGQWHSSTSPCLPESYTCNRKQRERNRVVGNVGETLSSNSGTESQTNSGTE